MPRFSRKVCALGETLVDEAQWRYEDQQRERCVTALKRRAHPST
jgi:hypothetical protein